MNLNFLCFLAREFLKPTRLAPMPCALISLCCLCVLCVSVVVFSNDSSTTEAQRTQRLHREVYAEDLSRKGAKAQSATAFLKGFLCAFAPLRLCAFAREC